MILILNCDNSPLKTGLGQLKNRITFLGVVAQINSAAVQWGCLAEDSGFLAYGKTGAESILTLGKRSKNHSIVMNGLAEDTNYIFFVSCGELGGKATSVPLSFKTGKSSPSPGLTDIQKRSIWILGGSSNGSSPVSQVDMYDPVENIWYSDITKIPTPRLFSGIVSLHNKIYVMGGLTSSLSPSNLVEEYDPVSKTWKTMSSMPVNLQGFVSSAVGEDIYALGGTTTADMTTGTVLNTVYKFTPALGDTGTWTTKNSFTALAPKVDMAGCAIDGTVFFNTGRYYSDGTSQATSDGYVVSANTSTSVVEALFTARHGAGSACYRPLPTDSYPYDLPLMIVVGGSTLGNFFQPVTSTTESALFEYSYAGTTNSVLTGPVLPVSRYMPALEISYEKRSVYVFGGGSLVNAATNTVYSLDLSNPSAGPWSLSTTMPVSRIGHKAVILSR